VPKVVSNEELSAIVSLIIDQDSGISANELIASLGITLPKKTLQRRLQRLLKEGRITATGVGRGKKYFPAQVYVKRDEYSSHQDEIVFSYKSKELRRLIMQPLTSRVPVGYEVDFLNSYIPNESYYINQNTRRKLVDFGSVGVEELPAGTYLRQLMDRLLIDLSWNSSRLEGNTYSLLETQRLIDLGVEAEGKNLKDAKMILNHKAAIELLSSQSDAMGFNTYTICNLHALLSDELLYDNRARGQLRTKAVGISGSVYLPLENPQLINTQFLLFLQKASEIEDPIEQSFFAMVHLPYLQPFEDVNKRVSRLVANIPLMKHNLCPLSFIDVPKEEYIHGLLAIYERNEVDYLRDVFEWSYERSAAKYSAIRQTLGEPDPFRFRYRALVDTFVCAVVEGKMNKGSAIRWIAETSIIEVPEEDRAKFIEIVENELMSLHIGSIARYKLLPNTFEQWQHNWV